MATHGINVYSVSILGLSFERLTTVALSRSTFSLLQGGESCGHSCCTDEGGVPEAHKLFEFRLYRV